MTARTLRWTASPSRWTYGLFAGQQCVGYVYAVVGGTWRASFPYPGKDGFGQARTAWGSGSALLRALGER